MDEEGDVLDGERHRMLFMMCLSILVSRLWVGTGEARLYLQWHSVRTTSGTDAASC